MFISTASIAGEVILSGTYQGKDIYVQNPFNKTLKRFCTTSVFVNEVRILENPSITAFKIDLSEFNKDDEVRIRLEYIENCSPTIVNPDALVTKGAFQFTNASSDNNSISWSAIGEEVKSQYFIFYKYKNSEWSIVDTLQSKNKQGINSYTHQPNYKMGENTYKIIYKSPSKSVESKEFTFTAAENYISFYPQIATTSLILSDTSDYEIESYFGKKVKKGNGKEINVTGLKPGKYYLIVQNRKLQFIKR